MSPLSLTPEQWRACADSLNLEVCLLKAVAEVESAGNGFLPGGRPVILFEGHVFWKQLELFGLDPARYETTHPNVVYPVWDRAKYKGKAAEYERLAAASSIHLEAALRSASWGAFQIMGFNFAACGFADVHAFVAAMCRGPEEHLKAFAAFLQSQKLVDALKSKNWAGFARRYNGRDYAKNHYDEELAKAYERCRKAAPTAGSKPADPETKQQPRRVKIDPLPDAAARPIGE